jgi:hypothetical protein
LEQARLLREALRVSLFCQNDTELSSAEFEASGVREYIRITGKVIRLRRWRDIFKRTITRDAGAENWQRLELYLPDGFRKKNSEAPTGSTEYPPEFEIISALPGRWRDSKNPSASELQDLWDEILKIHRMLTMQGWTEKAASRKLLSFVSAEVPFLSSSRKALGKMFERKRDAWVSGGENIKALESGHSQNGGSHDDC